MRSAAAFRAPMLLLALRGVSGAAAALRAPMLLLAMRSVSGAAMPVRTASVRLLSTAPAISETQKAAMAFLDGSPDPFHACARARERLEAAGFVELDEREPWAGRIAPGGRYFWTRNRSCLVAFAVGEGYEPGDGFKIIGAHTDSPNLKVKPRSMRDGSAASCTQVPLARAARGHCMPLVAHWAGTRPHYNNWPGHPGLARDARFFRCMDGGSKLRG